MLPLSIPSSNVVKDTAKTIMKKRPLASVIICLFLVAVFFANEFIFSGMLAIVFGKRVLLKIAVAILLFITIFWPVFMGAIRYFWVAVEQKECGIDEVFYYFSSFLRYKKAVKTVTLLLLKVFLIGVVALIPCMVSSLFEHSWIYNTLKSDVPLWSANLQLITDFLKIAGIAVTFWLSLKFYLVPIVAVMDENLALMDAIHISEMISKQSLSAFSGLIISFLGWFLLSLLGIPIVYTLPYFLISYVVHCRFAIVNYNLNLEQVSGWQNE